MEGSIAIANFQIAFFNRCCCCCFRLSYRLYFNFSMNRTFSLRIFTEMLSATLTFRFGWVSTKCHVHGRQIFCFVNKSHWFVSQCVDQRLMHVNDGNAYKSNSHSIWAESRTKQPADGRRMVMSLTIHGATIMHRQKPACEFLPPSKIKRTMDANQMKSLSINRIFFIIVLNVCCFFHWMGFNSN